MKYRLSSVILLLCSSMTVFSQYDSALHYRYNSPTFYVASDTLIQRASADATDTGEGGPKHKLIRFQNFMGSRISNDVGIGADMTVPMGEALSSYMAHFTDYCPGSSYTGNWSCLGPFTNYYGSVNEKQGRITSIWVDHVDTSFILAGSSSGGLWRSTNGGHTWRNITDGIGTVSNKVLGMPGVYCIAVNPANRNIIYIALGETWQYAKSGGYNLGIAFTTDGGMHWQADTALASLIGEGPAPGITKIAYKPETQNLFAIHSDHVYLKDDSVTGWHDISPDSMVHGGVWCQDLQFSHVTNDAIVSTSANYGRSSLWSYNGSSWNRMIMTFSSTYSLYGAGGAKTFSMSSGDSAYIKFEAHNGSTLVNILVRTPLGTFNPTILNAAFPSNIMQFVVSPGNSHNIYIANETWYGMRGIYGIIKDGDTSLFTEMAGYGHVDGRCIFIDAAFSDSSHDVVYFGSDGGICKKSYGNGVAHSITGDSLAITEFYGFGNTEADENILTGGSQDNSGFTYIKTNTPPWLNVDGGDGYTSKFMQNGITKSIGENNGTSIYGTYANYGLTFSSGSISAFGVPGIPDSAISNINRPLHFDLDSNGYLGYCHIWKLPYASGSWSRAFPGGDPIDSGTYAYKKRAVDFYIDEINPDFAYVAYRDPAGIGNHPNSNNATGKLYFTNDARNPTGVPWTNITPIIGSTSIIEVNSINTIAVDPQNSNRIWVGLGNINFSYVGASPDTMKNRVLYSDDYGSTWSDVSKGLSALPVNKLVYRKGSDDELYAGTDVGIFKWNKVASQWECFNNGLPTCIVMDLEFNYCAGKLRAATYGRGIWETPLDNITIAPETLTTITTNTTWNTNKWLQSSVVVKSGAKLTITGSTIHMPKNGRIVVEPGAQLIVDNAKITNGCDQCFWKGIEAQGNSGLPQTTTNQGWVRIRNGSTIENAYIGVSNYNSSIGLTSTGGIVQGDGSFFINNQNAVTFKEYHNWSGSLLSPDRANFTNCTFLLDNNYKGNATGTPAFNNHVVLQGVDGISFIGCQFLNRDTVAPFKVRGEGIHASDASILVQAYCYSGYMGCPYPVKNRFCGFTNGITIEYTGAGLPLTSNIDRALFDTVTIGINNIAMNDVLMTRNHFKIGHGRGIHGYDLSSGTFSGCYQNIGILSQGSQQFRMEENTFDGAPVTVSGWYNIGTAVVSSGLFGNRVYRNTFDSLSFGVYALGDNRNTTRDPGLKILCNNFIHSTYDIAIATHDPLRPQGIGTVQGLPDVTYSGLDTSSGNTFSSGVTYNATNSTISRTEFHYRTASENPIESSTYLSTFPVSISPSCLPTFVSGLAHDATAHVTLGYVTFHKQKFREFDEDFQNTFSTYISLIDFGNTDSLKTVIGNSSDTSTLYSILSGGSPYISKEALKEVATTMTLPAYSMMHILFQNPDNLRDPDFLSVMEDTYTYPSSVMDAFADSATNQTNRTKMESAMSWLQGARDNHANIVLMALKTPIDTNITGVDSSWAEICTDTTSVYFLQDSNKHYVWLDSVDVWLQNIGGQWTEYERVGYHHFRGNTTEADNIFTDMGNSLPANSSEDTAKYVTYTKIWDAIKSAEADDRSIWSLDSTEIASLDTSSAALVTNNEAQLMILGITHIIPTSDYLPGGPGGPGGPGVPMPPPTAPDPCLTYVEAYKQSHNDNKEKPRVYDKDRQRFFAYPNPSSGIVTFSYDVPDAGGDMTITIKNIVGETVKQINTGNSKGTVQWDPGNLATGIYIYSATGRKGIISNGKLVLIK